MRLKFPDFVSLFKMKELIIHVSTYVQLIILPNNRSVVYFMKLIAILLPNVQPRDFSIRQDFERLRIAFAELFRYMKAICHYTITSITSILDVTVQQVNLYFQNK